MWRQKKAGLSSRTTITLSIYKFLFSNVILVASCEKHKAIGLNLISFFGMQLIISVAIKEKPLNSMPDKILPLLTIHNTIDTKIEKNKK